jgi:hypothetical protein
MKRSAYSCVKIVSCIILSLNIALSVSNFSSKFSHSMTCGSNIIFTSLNDMLSINSSKFLQFTTVAPAFNRFIIASCDDFLKNLMYVSLIRRIFPGILFIFIFRIELNLFRSRESERKVKTRVKKRKKKNRVKYQ